MSAERRIVRVEGHEAFKAHVEEWSKEKKGNLFVYFSGSKDPETGKSWCPDCVTAEPIVERLFKAADFSSESILLYVGVGPRPGWKDPQCIFRVEEPKISSVPTLVKWGTSKRLGDDYCNDESMVEMFFEDE